MPLVLLVPSSPWMKGEVEPRPDAVRELTAIPWELMEVGDSVLIHLHVPQLEILNAVFDAQHALKTQYRILMHSDCYELGRINPTKATPDELADFESWKKANGITPPKRKPGEEPPPSGPVLH
jgi:hypothetical protein